ncbi:MAG: hypothetical protein WCC55_08830 [Nitrosotalea sp.]
MRWHDEKNSMPNVPARGYLTEGYSSATHSPKQKIWKKNSGKKTHQHEWYVYLNRWVCDVCGRVYG